MAEKIGTECVAREKGFLYVVQEDGYVYKVPIPIKVRPKLIRASEVQVPINRGFRYFLDKHGFVSRVPSASAAR